MKTQTPFFASALLIVSFTFFIGCRKSEVYPAPQITLSNTADTVELFVGDSLEIRAIVANSVTVEHSWKINDSLYSIAYNLVFSAGTKGNYVMTYHGGNITSAYERKIIIVVIDRLRPVMASSSKYITKVLDYLPAPGQFVNESTADSIARRNIIGENGSLLSLGGFGGYVIFTFDHSILNREGMDLGIYSDPVQPPYEWSEPGIVMVSHDRNGNGQADDPWYELAGSESNSPDTKRNYRITYYNPKATKDVHWKDNLGDTGSVIINTQHNHNYYPLFAANQDSISFEGTRLRSNSSILDSTFINKGFPLGYADNYSVSDLYAQKGYNSFDITWAINASGQKVNLPAIDFVKVYTGQNDKGNSVRGEISTEIKGAIDLNL